MTQERHATRCRLAIDVRDEGDDVGIPHAVRVKEDLGRRLRGDPLHPPPRGDDVDVVAPDLRIVRPSQEDIVGKRLQRWWRTVEEELR